MKRIFIIPILLFASFMTLLYGVLPQAGVRKETKINYLKIDQDVKNRQEYFIGLRNTLLEVFTYQETLNKISASMSGEVSLSSIIGFFQQKASDNGLTLKSISPFQTVLATDDLTKPEQTPSESFSMSLGGSSTSFEGFLKDIRTSQRLVDVESFSFQQEKDSSSLGITVQVKVYY